MIYNSAGHHNLDSGAVAMYKGKLIKENENAVIIRNKISARLKERGYSFIIDKDTETLSAYLNRIKPGNGSVGCEHHLNASTNAKATGVEVVVKNNANPNSIALAKDLAKGISSITGIPLRNGNGVITENDTHRGKLGLLHKEGIWVLIEYGFITNSNDMDKLYANLDKVCSFVADTLITYEDKIK